MARTQDALYADIDLELSWSERDLPERERTKHVHRLHPYLGKFIPQLVETLLDRYLTRGGHVLDPFAGSGTTLVQALESGFDATGVDIAAFNGEPVLGHQGPGSLTEQAIKLLMRLQGTARPAQLIS